MSGQIDVFIFEIILNFNFNFNFKILYLTKKIRYNLALIVFVPQCIHIVIEHSNSFLRMITISI